MHRAVPILLLSFASITTATVSIAQEPASLPNGFLGMAPLEAIVRDPSIRAEIELTEDQYSKAKQLLSEHREKWLETARQAGNLPADEATRFKQDEMDRYRAGIPATVQRMLDADQHARLQQVVFQSQLRYLGLRLLQAPSIVKVLGLSPEELNAWRIVLEEQEKRREERAEALYAERAESILSVLTPEQRAKFDQLYGEPYSKRWSRLPSFEYDDTLKMLRWGPILDLIRFADNRKEIEVIEEQSEMIAILLENYDREFRSLQRRFNLNRRDELQKGQIRDAIGRAQEASVRQLEEILLPHQMDRLKQIVFQVRVREQVVEPLLSPLVADALRLSTRQQELVRTTLRQKIAEATSSKDALWNETLNTCIQSLAPEQQVRFYKLVGKRFSPQ